MDEERYTITLVVATPSLFDSPTCLHDPSSSPGEGGAVAESAGGSGDFYYPV